MLKYALEIGGKAVLNNFPEARVKEGTSKSFRCSRKFILDEFPMLYETSLLILDYHKVEMPQTLACCSYGAFFH